MEANHSKDKIGVGIIGAGGVAAAHAKAYSQLPNVELIAIADLDESRARDFSQKYRILNWYTDDQELLKREDIQIVSICTPHYLHAPQAITALQSGKHVLVEKPMAISLQQADQMIQAAEQSQRQLGVIYQLRYEWDTHRAQHLLNNGLLGELFFCEANCLWWRRSAYYGVEWRGKWDTEGGGAVINQASHHIDMLIHLLGMPASVQASLATVAHPIEVEDWCQAQFQWENGLSCSFFASTAAELESDLSRLLILGTKGSLQLFPFRPHSRNDEVLAQMVDSYRSVPEPALTGHAAEIHDFVEKVTANESPNVNGHEGRKSLEVITAIYQAGFTGETVHLPLTPDAPCYTTEGKREFATRFVSSLKK